MVIYVSSGTDYSIYNKELADGNLSGGQQAQKFNSLIINGIAAHVAVTAISALPYNAKGNVKCARGEAESNNIRYIRIKNRSGKLIHKLSNVIEMIHEIMKAADRGTPTTIVCDSINLAASAASLYCAKRLKVSSVAIVTDIPEFMCINGMNIWMKLCKKLMKKHDGYVLLTEKMNDIVNPQAKPYIVMEGSCEMPRMSGNESKKDIPPVCMFSGSLWVNSGIEQMIKGFLRSCADTAELHFYGGGEFSEELKTICKKYPSVKYFGSVSNQTVVEKQQKATLLINPRLTTPGYTKYSFPSKLMEYMASGTPVLTTHLPGIPKEYDDYLFYVEDETEDGFARSIKAILEMTDENRVNLGKKAQAFIISNKSKEIQAERILALCEKCKR